MHELSATTSVRILFCASLVGAYFLSATIAHATGTGPGDTPPGETPTTPPLSTGGILGCLGQGARVANVGTTRAIGGVYVPVNDAAVTLNTGYLVYKECVLDGITRNIAQNGAAEAARQNLVSLETGRGGAAQYVRNPTNEVQERGNGVVQNNVSETSLSGICSAFRQDAQRNVVRGYLRSIGSDSQQYSCPLASGTPNAQLTYREWFAQASPPGNVVGATANVAMNTAEDLVEDERNIRQIWDWNRGLYSVFDGNPNPLAQNIITPGFLIADAISQSTGSGFRQLENANEIDQIVSNLFSGLTTRLIGSSSGIPGLFTPAGGQPAYLDRMVSQTQAMVRSGAVNAALAVLAGARQTEAAYFAAKQGIGTAILGAENQLRGMENQCWELIIPAVRTHAAANGNPTLVIATSTQFSQPIVDAQLRALASTTAAEVTVAQQALTRIDQMIVQVQNSASPAAQQQVILQLEQMITNGEIHSTQDAQNAATQRDSVASALATLVSNTRTAWADSTDPNIGWCNVNNTAVVQRWFNEWRR